MLGKQNSPVRTFHVENEALLVKPCFNDLTANVISRVKSAVASLFATPVNAPALA